MEYTIENFNLDMRRINLFAESAYMEYAFTVEEATLNGSDESVFIEAEESLGSKVAAVIHKITEKVKEFFTNLLEKIKNFFSSKRVNDAKNALDKDPKLRSKKAEFPNAAVVEDACKNRFAIRKKIMDEYKAGTLTKDRLDELVSKHDAFMDKAKKAGKVVAVIGAVATTAFAAYKFIEKDAKKSPEITEAYNRDLLMKKLKDENVSPTEIANLIANGVTLDSKMMSDLTVEQINTIITASKSAIADIDNTRNTVANKNNALIDKMTGEHKTLVNARKELAAKVNAAKKSKNTTLYADLKGQLDALDKKIENTSSPDKYITNSRYNGGKNMDDKTIQQRKNLERGVKRATKFLYKN